MSVESEQDEPAQPESEPLSLRIQGDLAAAMNRCCATGFRKRTDVTRQALAEYFHREGFLEDPDDPPSDKQLCA